MYLKHFLNIFNKNKFGDLIVQRRRMFKIIKDKTLAAADPLVVLNWNHSKIRCL